jgi:hypothetical protein
MKREMINNNIVKRDEYKKKTRGKVETGEGTEKQHKKKISRGKRKMHFVQYSHYQH